MIKKLFSFFFRRKKELVISKKVLDVHKEPFCRHEDYLALTVPYEPVRKLHRRLEKLTGFKLFNRGEAHVTVITPSEYEILKETISMEELEDIALREKIQEADLELVCVGEGRIEDNGNKKRTYYIVVKSERLMRIRERVEKIFRARGGREEGFVASRFYPHITVGFTDEDLHYEQGVIKDRRSCRYPLKVK